MNRTSGILLHISSLPSKYGIGRLGRAAYEFADFLKSAKQTYWQLLPMGPTGYGDSPYQSFSNYAGNPYFIDPDILEEKGLLSTGEAAAMDWGGDECVVDYGKVYENTCVLLRRAYENSNGAGVDEYTQRNPWTADYALFMALKDHFEGLPWTEWPDEDIRLRKPEAVEKYTRLLKEGIGFYAFTQMVFYEQWGELLKKLGANGIKIIGDVPIYVPLDSVDVWANPEVFELDDNHKPRGVAGVPPDYFSPDGQLWGNPLYDWQQLKNTGYRWWLDRIEAASRMYDVIRIDHFRGFAGYYRVDAGAKTAKEGRWIEGPGMSFINAVKQAFPNMDIIAEDLGFLTSDVHALREASGFPGMKILQFAFDSREPSDYLPHNYGRNCVCYTGTHDNTTAAAWFSECAPEDLAYAKRYLGLSEEEGWCWGLIRGGMSSVAELFVAQMQDYLELGAECRMNTPGLLGKGNWCWRMKDGAATEELAARIADMTRIYGRTRSN